MIQSIHASFFLKLTMGMLLVGAIALGFFHTLWNPYWADGDEVHYLIMTQSFLSDGDFDLRDEYDNFVYAEYHGRREGYHAVVSPVDGSLRSWHNILISIIAAPGFMAQGMLGARISLFVLNTAIAFFAFHTLWKSFGIDKPTRYGILAVFFTQFSVILYSQYVYTDLLTGLFWLLAYTLIAISKSSQQKPYLLIIAGSLLGIGIFLNFKMILIGALTIGFWIFERYRQDILSFKTWRKPLQFVKNLPWKDIVLITAPFLLGYLAFNTVMWRWFGVFSHDAAHEIVFEEQNLQVFGNPFRSLFGQFFDTSTGLLVFSPLFIFSLPGFFVWYQKHQTSFWQFAVPGILYIFMHSFFFVWRSWAPPVRYLIIPLPILATSAMFFLTGLWSWLRAFLAAITTAISVLIVTSLFYLRSGGYPPHTPSNSTWKWIAETVPGIPQISGFAIDFLNPTASDYILAAGITVAMLLLGYGVMYSGQFNKKT